MQQIYQKWDQEILEINVALEKNTHMEIEKKTWKMKIICNCFYIH